MELRVVKLRKNEHGFSAVEGLLILVLVGIIGFVGWYVYHSNKQANSSLNAATQDNAHVPKANSGAKKSTPISTGQKQYLDNNKVSYTLPSNWEVTSQTQSDSLPCGQATTSNVAACVDKAGLVLKNEGFVDTDHFHAEISVFNNPNGQNAKDWFGSLGLEGTGGAGTNMTVKGMSVYKYSINPTVGDNSEVHLYYAITSGKEAVLVASDLFSGNHYSFTTTNNYLGYSNDVGVIANSVSISN